MRSFHLAEHAKQIQKRQVDILGGEGAKSGKNRLARKGEGPAHRAFQINVMPLRQRKGPT